jgi:hypothetical protein
MIDIRMLLSRCPIAVVSLTIEFISIYRAKLVVDNEFSVKHDSRTPLEQLSLYSVVIDKFFDQKQCGLSTIRDILLSDVIKISLQVNSNSFRNYLLLFQPGVLSFDDENSNFIHLKKVRLLLVYGKKARFDRF